jgi:hypothetical protein
MPRIQAGVLTPPSVPPVPLVLEVNGVLNGSQVLLNLVQSGIITVSDDGLGNVTINAPAPVLNFLPLAGGTLTGDLLFSLDNAHDIGASGATRPRTTYVGTSVLAPLFNAATGFQVAGTATLANVLRGNGTVFVSATLAAADLSNGTTGTGPVVLNTNPVIGGNLTGVANVLVGTGATTDAGTWGFNNGNGPGIVFWGNGSAGVGDMFLTTNGVLQIRLYKSGGLDVGSAVGGDKGAGSINIAADIYKNNLAYTNPDYVLEKWATGKIEKYRNNEGVSGYRLMSIAEIREFAKANYRLPRISEGAEPTGIFERSDKILEKIEELYIHIFQMDDRIRELESRLKVALG